MNAHPPSANPVWWRSLKTRMTLLTLAIFLLGIWSLSLYASRMLRQDMKHLLGDQQSSTVSLVAAQLGDELEFRLRALESMASGVTPAILGNSVAMQAFMDDRLISPKLFNSGISVVDREGTVIADVPRSIGRIGINYMDRDYLVSALKEGKSSIGQPVIGRTQRAPVLVMAAPIRDAQGQVIGALFGVINLNKPNFLDKITDTRYGETGGYLLIAPQYKLFVTATDKSRIMQALPAPGANPMLDRYLQGFEGHGVAVSSRGVEELSAAKGIPVAGWILVLVLPTAEAFAPINAMQQRMLISTLLLTLLVGGLTWWITAWMLRRQLSPMLAAARTLDTLSDTNQHPPPLPVTSQDEIGELIGGFNRLLKTLGQRAEALQESEFRYRSVADYTSDWEFWVMPDGTFRYISPSCEQVSGYSADEFRADPELVKRIIHPDDRPLYEEHVHRESTRSVPQTIDFRIRTKAGKIRWIAHVCRPIIDSGGQALGLRASNRDITERKQAELELERANTELAQQSRVIIRTNADLQRFAEVTAHHLQEPARRLASYAERLSSQLAGRVDDPEARLSLDYIGQQARRMKNLLGDVERYLAADQPRGKIESVEAHQIVSHLLQRWARPIAETGSVVTVGDLPPAWIDAPRLTDLFEVALDNALRHGGGSNLVTIDGERRGALVRYRIGDNGPGIEEEYRERVFRVFERLGSGGESTGIGLSILRRVAESCGGRAWIEDNTGCGCRVLFELPAEEKS